MCGNSAAGISSYVFAVFPVLTGQRGIGNRNPHAVCAEDSLCRSAAGRTACQSLCRGDGGLWGSDILSHYLYECECIHIGGIPGGVYDPAVP